jgi:hypothetical protein
MPATRTVRFQYLDADGDPVAGSIKFTPTVTVVDSETDDFYTLAEEVITLDADGFGEVVLACTNDPDLAPTGWAWAVQELIPGGRNKDNTFFVNLPTSSPDPVNLNDLPGAIPTAFSVGGGGGVLLIGELPNWFGEELPTDPSWVPPYRWTKPDGTEYLVLDDETSVPYPGPSTFPSSTLYPAPA